MLYFNIQQQEIDKSSIILEDLLSKRKSAAGEAFEHTFDWENTAVTISYQDA
jgi:hypothetical protein